MGRNHPARSVWISTWYSNDPGLTRLHREDSRQRLRSSRGIPRNPKTGPAERYARHVGRCFLQACLPTRTHPGARAWHADVSNCLDGRRSDTTDTGGPYNASLIGDDDRRLVLEQPDYIFDLLLLPTADMPRERTIFAVEIGYNCCDGLDRSWCSTCCGRMTDA